MMFFRMTSIVPDDAGPEDQDGAVHGRETARQRTANPTTAPVRISMIMIMDFLLGDF